MIQGTVSLDDGKPDDCTTILPGMHKHIREWDETLTARGLSTGALVHRIQDSMFTSGGVSKPNGHLNRADAGKYVTLPHLPHRAYGSAKRVRRIMLGSAVCKMASKH